MQSYYRLKRFMWQHLISFTYSDRRHPQTFTQNPKEKGTRDFPVRVVHLGDRSLESLRSGAPTSSCRAYLVPCARQLGRGFGGTGSGFAAISVRTGWGMAGAPSRDCTDWLEKPRAQANHRTMHQQDRNESSMIPQGDPILQRDAIRSLQKHSLKRHTLLERCDSRFRAAFSQFRTIPSVVSSCLPVSNDPPRNSPHPPFCREVLPPLSAPRPAPFSAPPSLRRLQMGID